MDRRRVPGGGEAGTGADLRYAGQEYTVTVEWDPRAHGAAAVVDALPGWLDTAHRDRYGHSNPGEAVECVNLRMTALGRLAAAPPPELAPRDAAAPEDGARARFASAWHPTPVHRREALGPGTALAGPAIVLEDACTTVVPPGWAAAVAAQGTLIVERAS
jgi:N-methylhydantoinase A